MRCFGLVVFGLVGCVSPEVAEWSPGAPWTVQDMAPPEPIFTELVTPMGLAVMSPTQLWVVDEGADRVLLLTTDGEIEQSIDAVSGPRWVAYGPGEVVVTEPHDQGRVLLFTDQGDAVQTLSVSQAPWGQVTYGGERFWWFEEGQSVLYWWLDGQVGQRDLMRSIVALTGTSEGVRVAIGDRDPWEIVNGLGESLGEVDYAPQALAWQDGVLWGTTRSARWPFGGWVVRWDAADAELVQYSPPEPGPLALTDSAVFWGSKQTLTQFSLDASAYEAIAVQTAVGDVVSVDGGVFWTDRQRGALFSWTPEPQ
jgi:hypothetical protein